MIVMGEITAHRGYENSVHYRDERWGNFCWICVILDLMRIDFSQPVNLSYSHIILFFFSLLFHFIIIHDIVRFT